MTEAIRCPTCGYVLHDPLNNPPCPECGFHEPDARFIVPAWTRRPSWVIPTLLAVALAYFVSRLILTPFHAGNLMISAVLAYTLYHTALRFNTARRGGSEHYIVVTDHVMTVVTPKGRRILPRSRVLGVRRGRGPRRSVLRFREPIPCGAIEVERLWLDGGDNVLDALEREIKRLKSTPLPNQDKAP